VATQLVNNVAERGQETVAVRLPRGVRFADVFFVVLPSATAGHEPHHLAVHLPTGLPAGCSCAAGERGTLCYQADRVREPLPTWAGCKACYGRHNRPDQLGQDSRCQCDCHTELARLRQARACWLAETDSMEKAA
jgi:hypothetical protein